MVGFHVEPLRVPPENYCSKTSLLIFSIRQHFFLGIKENPLPLPFNLGFQLRLMSVKQATSCFHPRFTAAVIKQFLHQRLISLQVNEANLDLDFKRMLLLILQVSCW